MLIDIVPTYNSEQGASEWGLGWSSSLHITRWTRNGLLSFSDSDERMTPWGSAYRDANDNTLWHCRGHQWQVRVRESGDTLVAYLPSLVKVTFRDLRGDRRIWSAVDAENNAGATAKLFYLDAQTSPRLWSVHYGTRTPGATPTWSYTVGFGYEQLDQDYRPVLTKAVAGSAYPIRYRVKRVEVRVRNNLRYAYDIGYTNASANGALFHLSRLQQTFASGEQAPAVTYAYGPENQEPDRSVSRLATWNSYLAGVSASDFVARSSFYYDRLGGPNFVFFHLWRPADPPYFALRLDQKTGAVQRVAMQQPVIRAQSGDPNLGNGAVDVRILGITDDPFGTQLFYVSPGSNTQCLGAMPFDPTVGPLQVQLCGQLARLSGDRPLATALADIDRDGRVDLVYALGHKNGSIEVTGLVQAPSPGPPTSVPLLSLPATSVPRRISTFSTGDFNGDGRLDVVLRPDSPGADYSVYVVNGANYWEPQAHSLDLPDDANGTDASVSFGDVNADGLADAIFTWGSGYRSPIYINQGLHTDALGVTRYKYAHVGDVPRSKMNAGVPMFIDLLGDGRTHLVLADDVGTSESYIQVELADVAYNRVDTHALTEINDGRGNLVLLSYDFDPHARIKRLAKVIHKSIGERDMQTVMTYERPRSRPGIGFVGYERVVTAVGPAGFGSWQTREAIDFGYDSYDADYVVTIETSEPPGGGSRRSDFIYTPLPERLRLDAESSTAYGVRLEEISYGWDASNECIRTVSSRREIDSAGVSSTALVTTVLNFWPGLSEYAHCLGQDKQQRPSDVPSSYERTLYNERGQPTSFSVGASLSDLHIRSSWDYTNGHLTAISRPGHGQQTFRYLTPPLLHESTAENGLAVRIATRDPITRQPLEILTAPASQMLAAPPNGVWTYLRYDGRERLARTWSSIAGSAERPLLKRSYQAPSASAYGRVYDDMLADDALPATSSFVSILTGSERAVVSAAATSGGWLTSVKEVDRGDYTSRAHQLSLRREPVDALTGIGDSTLIGTTWHTSLGTFGRSTAVIQDGVEAQVEVDVSGGAAPKDPTQRRIRTQRSNIDPAGGSESSTYATVAGIRELVDEQGRTTEFAYNARGSLKQIATPDYRYDMTYDYEGKRTSVTFISGGVQLGVQYTYDEASGLLKQKTFTGNGTSGRYEFYTHDDIGRLTAITYTDGALRSARIFAFFYDGRKNRGDPVIENQRGRLTAIVGPDSEKTFTYRSDGALIESVVNVRGEYAVRSTFDYFANQTQRAKTVEVLNPRDALVCSRHSMSFEVELDRWGQSVRQLVNGQLYAEIERDEWGRIAAVRRADGEQTLLTYDRKLPFLLRQETRVLPNQKTRHAGWNFNAQGRLASEAFATIAGGAAFKVHSYDYDTVGRLRAVHMGGETGTYTYVEDELQTSLEAGVARSVSEMSTGINVTVTAGSTSRIVAYRRDSLGRIDRRTEDGFSTSVSYNSQGQIATSCISSSSSLPTDCYGDSTQFLYDESGQRIGVVGSDGVLHAHFPGLGTMGPAGFRAVVHHTNSSDIYVSSEGVTSVASDIRGSALASQPGQTASDNIAWPFGERTHRPAHADVTDFAGLRWEPATGALRAGVRDYEPQLGRFWQPDPLFLEQPELCLDSPHECGLYSYAANDPVNFIDPSGLTRNATPTQCGGGVSDGQCAGPMGGTVSVTGTNPTANYTPNIKTPGYFGPGHDSSNPGAGGFGGGADGERLPGPRRAGEERDLAIALDLARAFNRTKKATAYGAAETAVFAAAGAGVGAVLRAAGAVLTAARGAAQITEVGGFKLTKTVAGHLDDVITRGPFKGELARPYINSPLTIQEIMAGGKPIADPGGVAGALRWDVPGTFRGTQGTWQLVVDPKTNTILHFLFGP